MTVSGHIPLAKPKVVEADLSASERALRSGRLVLGPENELLESLLSELCGRKSAVALSSGTAALELGLNALGLKRGGEVLVGAYGFPAAASALVRMGLVPVPVDVDPRTWLPDLADVRRAMSKDTVAAVSIDAFGLAAGAGLDSLCEELGIVHVCDSACSLGALDERGQPGAALGQFSVLSFHPRKIVTCGEGGALLTDDPGLASAVRRSRNHGQEGSRRFVSPGSNRRLAENAAAMASAQLQRLDGIVRERNLLAQGYFSRLEALAKSGRISWQLVPEGAQHAYQSFCIELHGELSRSELVAAMAAREIEVGIASFSLMDVPSIPCKSRETPVASRLHEQAIALPLYLDMRSQELDRVASALEEVLLVRN